MTSKQFSTIGRVVKTHGLKGEVSVAPATETPFSALCGLDVWFVPPAAGLRSSSVVSSRPGPKGPLVTFAGVEGIDSAKLLEGREVLARTDELPAEWLEDAAEEPGFEGYTVVDDRRGLIGEIVETIVTGANDVWVVEGAFGEVLVPVIDDVVLETDDVGRSVRVSLLEGLMPDEAAETC